MKKRNLFATIALVLTLALVAPAFLNAPAASVEAAKKAAKKKTKKVALNKKKATLTVGQNLKLKVKNNKNKVTWKSSKKAVAAVSKKGIVKAKKVGKATITAKVGGKTYKCKITVKAPAPVAPKDLALTQIGKKPYKRTITREFSYETYEEDDYTYHYMYIDFPVTLNSVNVTYGTTNTTLGDYTGTGRYNVTISGKVTIPTKCYSREWNEKTQKYDKKPAEIPADQKARVEEIKKDVLNSIYVDLIYLNANNTESSTYRGNITVADEDFYGCTSTYKVDASGNFTITATDVSIYGQYNNFRVGSVSANGGEWY